MREELDGVHSLLQLIDQYPEQLNKHQRALFRKFAKVDIKHCKLSLLAKITPTTRNEEFLTKAWRRVLNVTSARVKLAKTAEERKLSLKKYHEAVQNLKALSTKTGNSKFKELLDAHPAIPTSAHEEEETIKVEWLHPLLKPHEAEQLRRLSKLLKDSRLHPEKLDKIKDHEKKLLQRFIFDILNNMEFNQCLLKLGHKIPFGITSEAIELAKTLSYKSRHHTQFIRLTAKAQNLAEKLDLPEAIHDNEKLSLQEFGILNQLASLSPLFVSLDGAKLLGEATYLKVLYEKSLQARELIDELNDRFQKSIQEEDIYQDGDIAAWHSSKWDQFLAKKPSSEVDMMRRWVTELGHGTYLYRGEADEEGMSPLMQSHIYGTYENEPVTIQAAVFSEVWRLQVSRLVDPSSSLYKALQEIYMREGKNIDDEIQKVYEQAAHQFHADTEENRAKFADWENEETDALMPEKLTMA